jgi:hypothetical protein
MSGAPFEDSRIYDRASKSLHLSLSIIKAAIKIKFFQAINFACAQLASATQKDYFGGQPWLMRARAADDLPMSRRLKVMNVHLALKSFCARVEMETGS